MAVDYYVFCAGGSKGSRNLPDDCYAFLPVYSVLKQVDLKRQPYMSKKDNITEVKSPLKIIRHRP